VEAAAVVDVEAVIALMAEGEETVEEEVEEALMEDVEEEEAVLVGVVVEEECKTVLVDRKGIRIGLERIFVNLGGRMRDCNHSRKTFMFLVQQL
jgi:hypothetical protein